MGAHTHADTQHSLYDMIYSLSLYGQWRLPAQELDTAAVIFSTTIVPKMLFIIILFPPSICLHLLKKSKSNQITQTSRHEMQPQTSRPDRLIHSVALNNKSVFRCPVLTESLCKVSMLRVAHHNCPTPASHTLLINAALYHPVFRHKANVANTITPQPPPCRPSSKSMKNTLPSGWVSSFFLSISHLLHDLMVWIFSNAKPNLCQRLAS